MKTSPVRSLITVAACLTTLVAIVAAFILASRMNEAGWQIATTTRTTNSDGIITLHTIHARNVGGRLEHKYTSERVE